MNDDNNIERIVIYFAVSVVLAFAIYSCSTMVIV